MTEATVANHNGSSAASIPELSGGRPLIGHLREFLKDPVGMLDRCWRDHGDLVRFRLGTRKFVLFTGPEAHDCYFRAPEEQLDARAGYQFTVPIFGRGVAYDVEPEIMAEQLGFLYPALRDASMRRYALRSQAAYPGARPARQSAPQDIEDPVGGHERKAALWHGH